MCLLFAKLAHHLSIYIQHSWSLSRVGLFATPTVTGDTRLYVNLRGPLTFNQLPRVWQWSCHYLSVGLSQVVHVFET